MSRFSRYWMPTFGIVLMVGVVANAALNVQVPTSPPPPEAYPGQRDHAKPPEGFYCSPQGKDAAHKCACKRMAQRMEGDPKDCCSGPVQEDPKCTVYCHMNHCLCPVGCDVKEHHHAGQ